LIVQFDQLARWSDLPWTEDVTGVAVDSDDNVFVLSRGKYPVSVFDSGGSLLAQWGDGWFSERPHQISIAPDGTVLVADDGGHRVHRFGKTGVHIATLGSGAPSQTGFDTSGLADPFEAFLTMKGGEPFNRPTKAVGSLSGEIFVSDGYRNCRVHRFSPTGDLHGSWGGAGSAEGCFVIPHSVGVDARGRVFVCDRENDRVQIFAGDGAFLETWEVQRPTDVTFDSEDNVYIAELALGPQDPRFARAELPAQELPGRISIFGSDGELLTRLDTEGTPLLAPHEIAVDSQGSIYVCEVPGSFTRSRGETNRARRCLQKFARR
jgi:DNA-binding beta-propeller fold protein YncE